MTQHVTEHTTAYTFLQFIGDLLERVATTRNLKQELTVELPNGASVSLRVAVVDAELGPTASDAVH